MYNTQKRPINNHDVRRLKALANSLSEGTMLSIPESNQLLEMRNLLNNVMLSPNDHSGQSFSPNQLDQRARMVILQIRQLVDHFQNEMFMGGPYNAGYNPSIFNVNPFVSPYEPRFQQPGFATDASLNINDPTVKQYQGKCLSIEELCKAVHGVPYNAVLLSDFEMDKIRLATSTENYGQLLRTDMPCPNDLKDLGREIYNVFGFGKVFVVFLDHDHKIANELNNRGISLSSEPLRSTSLRISVGKVQTIANNEQPAKPDDCIGDTASFSRIMRVWNGSKNVVFLSAENAELVANIDGGSLPNLVHHVKVNMPVVEEDAILQPIFDIVRKAIPGDVCAILVRNFPEWVKVLEKAPITVNLENCLKELATFNCLYIASVIDNHSGDVFTKTIKFTLADVRQTLNSFVESKANFSKPAAFVLSAADCAKVIELANGSVIGDGTTFDVSSSKLSTHQHNVLRGLLNPHVETKVLFVSDVDQVMTVLRDNGYDGLEYVSLDGPDVYAVKILQLK